LATESYALYLAADAYGIGNGGGLDGEEIAVRLVSLADAEAWLEKQRNSGLLVDPKVYAGLYFAMKS
jgi:ADP-ribose pyrophosphatase